MSQNQEFFQSPKDHSLIKLRVLEKFIRPWATKVGVGRSSPIYVVDGYAGEGRYAQGRIAGSPALILTVADELRRAEGVQHRDIRPIFVEMLKWRYERLTQVVAEYPGVPTTTICGDFWEHVDEIKQIVNGAPLLLVLDPFGIKGVILSDIVRIANASPKTDVLFTFMTLAALRIEEQYPLELRMAVGMRRHEEQPIDAFSRNLTTDAGFITAGRFEVRHSSRAKAKYEMIAFSRHVDAYQLLNDSMTDEAQQQALSLPGPTTQSMLPGLWEETAASTDLWNAAVSILDWAAEHGRPFLRKTMLNSFYTKRFASFNTKVLKAALKELGKQGQLVHDGGTVDVQLWRLP